MTERQPEPAPAGESGESAPAPGETSVPDDPDAAIEQAWGRVEAHWDDDSVHDEFVGLCSRLGRLPEAGRRYREVRDTDPERAQDARARIDRLLTLATRTLELGRSPPPDTDRSRRRLFFVALGLCLVLIGSALWAWLG